MAKQMNPAKQVIELNKKIRFLEKAIILRDNAAVNMAKDAACMAANDILKMGPGRAKDFCNRFDEYMIEMLHMCNEEALETQDAKGRVDTSIDYTKTKIDERLKRIVGEENFMPFEERYCWNDVTLLLQTPVGKVRLKQNG